MRYEAVLFDLDGTLTKSEPGIIKSVQYALRKLGRPELPYETAKTFIGPPLVDSFSAHCGMTREEAFRAVDLFREWFEPQGWKENSVYPGIASLLYSLKKRGVYVAVATSKPQAFAGRILDWFGLSPYVDHLEGEHLDERKERSKPELIRDALPQGLRACMVGDRRFDGEGARANGIDFVGALYGYGTRQELEAAGAVAVCDSVQALTQYLLEDAPEPGFFISFEGGDGCGKSTQMSLAAEYLTERGWIVRKTREPGGCPVSERVREILLDVKSEGMTPECEALLFAAARAQHVREVIRPALKRGEIVLCDRFLDSSLVYQGVGRALGMERVRAINAPAVEDTLPHLTLWYDLDPDVALARRSHASELDRMEREKHSFLLAVHGGFARLCEQEARISRIDASRSVEEIELDTRARLNALLAGAVLGGK